MATKAKAPFKRGTWLVWTNPTAGTKHDVKYIKWMGFERSALIVVERIDNGARFTVHVNDVKPWTKSVVH